MAKVPINLQNDLLSQYLFKEGLSLVSIGKVRNTWMIDDNHLLVVATDRISIFDFVLNASVPMKGAVLTALTHFWFTKVLSEFDNHLVKSFVHARANMAYDLKKNLLHELPLECCLIVENMNGKLYPFEMIYRHHIGGSVFKKYHETGFAGGHQLVPGLPKWSKLDRPIFTPSTKEDVGHDVNIDADYFFQTMTENGLGDESHLVVENLEKAYAKAYNYALARGISILDTKFEVAGLKIVDEILTPDSSRFAFTADCEQALEGGRDPYFLDKQPVRDWGAKILTPFNVIGINKLNPENPAHVNFVHSLEIPTEIITETTNRYLQVFELLTGLSLADYQQEFMGIKK